MTKYTILYHESELHKASGLKPKSMEVLGDSEIVETNIFKSYYPDYIFIQISL